MRVVLQRVLSASVVINHNIFSSIDKGLLILVGIESSDKDDDIEWLVNKIVSLRIFNDDEGKMNLSAKDVGGEYLVISQFTLHASTKKGNRPSYIKAARPEYAIMLYEKFVERLKKVSNNNVKTGVFAADMKVNLINDGPVTIVIDSKQKE
ncbi:MAG: D-aminoacyl-tRNA deacylase [Saprospiraceae bacterium]|nr:D-tyrosyl-tRNA(Tyr) deacylase [Saprospiraceae bacterium]